MEDLCEQCGAPLVGGFCELCSDPFIWPADESAPDPLVGLLLEDRYTIEALLSIGGMARLYRGVQRSLERKVAIKILPPRLIAGGDPDEAAELVSRFFVEAQTASRLTHPNVVRILDFGRMKKTGLLYMVMELLSGTDLWDLIQEVPELPLPRIGNITIQILQGLAEAHSMGITHRDIKPENVIVDTSRGIDLVKVIDFGVAKLGPGQSLTKTGRVVGSPQYMSPEQARGEQVGPPADLYSVGVVLYEMLCGEVPFDGKFPMEIMKAHVSQTPPDPRQLTKREIPEPVVDLCLRALAKQPKDRYPDALSFASAVADVLAPQRASLTDVFSAMSTAPVSRPAVVSNRLKAPTSAGPTIRAAPSLVGEGLLYGRVAHLARVRELVTSGGGDRRATPHVTMFYGPDGSGRSRLAREAAEAARQAGAHVVAASAPPHPLSEVGFSALGELVARMLDTRPGDERLASGAIAESPLVAGGLRMLSGRASVDPNFSAAFVRRAVSVAFDWACQKARLRAGPSVVLCVLDDVHRWDGGSLKTLVDTIASGRHEAFRWLLLGGDVDLGLPRQSLIRLPLPLLPREDALAWVEASPPAAELPHRDELEPLFIELCQRWTPRNVDAIQSLDDLVTRRVRGLGESLRRSLEAVAVFGGGPVDQIGGLLKRPEDLDAALWPLAEQGMLEIHDGPLRVTHASIARIALAEAPAATRTELHTRAAELVADAGAPVELTAHHAIRGAVDFTTFFTVESAVKVREQRGDVAGAIALLADGMQAARALRAAGDVEAADSARAVFGAKLAELGRADLAEY